MSPASPRVTRAMTQKQMDEEDVEDLKEYGEGVSSLLDLKTITQKMDVLSMAAAAIEREDVQDQSS